MSAMKFKTADLLVTIAGHEAAMKVQIVYVRDPGSEGAPDEPACDAFPEILAIRIIKNSDLGADIMPMLPSALIDQLEREIAEEMVTA